MTDIHRRNFLTGAAGLAGAVALGAWQPAEALGPIGGSGVLDARPAGPASWTSASTSSASTSTCASPPPT